MKLDKLLLNGKIIALLYQTNMPPKHQTLQTTRMNFKCPSVLHFVFAVTFIPSLNYLSG